MSWAEDDGYDAYDPEEIPEWKTKDGRLLRFVDMETSHLLNCKKLQLRRLSERPVDYGGGGLDDSEMVQDAIRSEEQHNELLAGEIEESIRRIDLELERRE